MTTIIISLVNNNMLPITGIISLPAPGHKLKSWEVSGIREMVLRSGQTTLGVVLSTPMCEKVDLPLGESIMVHGNQVMATQEEGPEGLEMIELKIITGMEEEA